jgi:hypothetical protein
MLVNEERPAEQYHQSLAMRTDIEAGNRIRPSLGRQDAPESASISDKVDFSHFDTVDLQEESDSDSSTASFRTSKADLDEGTNANHLASKINQTACFTCRAKYIVGAFGTILAGIALLLYFVNYTNSQDSLWTLTGDNLFVEGDGYFGYKVFISDDGNRIAVYTGAAMYSAVTFYDRRVAPARDDKNVNGSETWVQVARLGHNGTGPTPPVVTMSGDGKMIGSAYPRSSQPLQTYRLVENSRTGRTELMPIGSGLYRLESPDDFVSSLAFSKDGTRMVVGAGGNSYGKPGGNYAVVYDLVDGEWAQTGNVLNGIIFYDDDPSSSSRLDLCQENLGATVAVNSSGKRIALAAPISYVCDLSKAGAVKVYEQQDEDTNEWIQVGKNIQLEGIVRNDAIGSTLSISDDGNRLAIGTEGKLAAVVELNSETQDWEIVGEVFNLYSEQPAADLLTKGVQVALSGDGMRLALTAPFGGPPSDGMYTTSGYVRVFEYNANGGKDQASFWKPVGRTVSFEDEFGTAADLSADGTTLVTGWRYYQSGNRTVAFDGLVRVYSAPGATT